MKQTNSKIKNKSYRDDILEYALKEYKTKPEYPWMSLPGYAVLRHSSNKKWYGIIMNVSQEKIGLSGQGIIDILDIKCDPVLLGSLMSEKGILPAYHMHKGNWITVLLDGSVDRDLILSLLQMSYELTTKKQTHKKTGYRRNTEWIVPANPKYYDLEKAFSESETILWKQSNNILVGDIVYLYVAAPVSAIRYKCRAVETDIPYEYDDGKVHMSRVMKIKLLHKFMGEELSFNMLKEYGIYAIRGPRSIPNTLSHKIQEVCCQPKI